MTDYDVTNYYCYYNDDGCELLIFTHMTANPTATQSWAPSTLRVPPRSQSELKLFWTLVKHREREMIGNRACYVRAHPTTCLSCCPPKLNRPHNITLTHVYWHAELIEKFEFEHLNSSLIS